MEELKKRNNEYIKQYQEQNIHLFEILINYIYEDKKFHLITHLNPEFKNIIVEFEVDKPTCGRYGYVYEIYNFSVQSNPRLFCYKDENKCFYCGKMINKSECHDMVFDFLKSKLKKDCTNLIVNQIKDEWPNETIESISTQIFDKLFNQLSILLKRVDIDANYKIKIKFGDYEVCEKSFLKTCKII